MKIKIGIFEENLIIMQEKDIRLGVNAEYADVVGLLNKEYAGNGGKVYADLTYATNVDVYKTKKVWRADKVTFMLGMMQKDKDAAWYKDLQEFNSDSEAKKNPIAGVISVSKYHFRWTNAEDFAAETERYNKAKSSIRLKYGLGADSNGSLGGNRNQKIALGDGTKENQTGNVSIDIMLHDDDVDQTVSTRYYRVDGEGNITEEIPYAAVAVMTAEKSDFEKEYRYNPEKIAKETLDETHLIEYAKEMAALSKTYNVKNILQKKTLSLSVLKGDFTCIFINKEADIRIAKGSEVSVNNEQLREVAFK